MIPGSRHLNCGSCDEKKELKCPICGMTFESEEKLKAHKKEKHM